MDFDEIEHLRSKHAAWALLRSPHAALVLGFLGRVFVAANASNLPASQLVSELDDELFALNQRADGERFPRSAREYLDDWAAPERGWLRRYYPPPTGNQRPGPSTEATRASGLAIPAQRCPATTATPPTRRSPQRSRTGPEKCALAGGTARRYGSGVLYRAIPQGHRCVPQEPALQPDAVPEAGLRRQPLNPHDRALPSWWDAAPAGSFKVFPGPLDLRSGTEVVVSMQRDNTA